MPLILPIVAQCDDCHAERRLRLHMNHCGFYIPDPKWETADGGSFDVPEKPVGDRWMLPCAAHPFPEPTVLCPACWAARVAPSTPPAPPSPGETGGKA